MTTYQLRPGTAALNIRPGPATTHVPPIGLVRSGEVVVARGQTFDGTWVWVEAPAGRGWIAAAYLVAAGEQRITRESAVARLGLVEDFLPSSAPNRPGKKLRATFITVHNTANASAGADALMHARYLRSDDAKSRRVSWHFTVDDVRVVQHLPTRETGWHAGPDGNLASIGVEVCENEGIDEAAAVDRAALLVALLCKDGPINVEHVRTHQSWTGKNCPHVILHRPGGFPAFVDRVRHYRAQMKW